MTGATIGGPGAQGVDLDTQATNACVTNNIFAAGSGMGTAIRANGEGDLGLGNLLNGLGSNLPIGVGGTFSSSTVVANTLAPLVI